MKLLSKALFVILLSFFGHFSVQAQQADQRIGELLNDEDWFGLIDEYPALKDNLHYPFIGQVAEVMICNNTGRQEQALSILDDLLRQHQSELGGNAAGFLAIRAQILEKLGRYAEAADFLTNVLAQYKAQGVTQGLKALEDLQCRLNAERGLPPMSVSRPNHDVSVSFTLKLLKPIHTESWMKERKKPAKTSLAIMVPVKFHGKTLPFWFDTGAERTFVTEAFCREHGLPILGDSIQANSTTGLQTFIDSLQVGDITVRNIVALVGTGDNNKVFDLVGNNAVLGRDIMKAVGELQLCMADSTLLFPVRPMPRPASGINMLENSQVRAQSASGENLTMAFDTGNADVDACLLFAPYYDAHSEEIDAHAYVDTISGGGYGEASSRAMQVLPGFTIRLAGHDIHVGEAIVDLAERYFGRSCSGSIGMAAVLQSKRITLNYRDLFIKVE